MLLTSPFQNSENFQLIDSLEFYICKLLLSVCPNSQIRKVQKPTQNYIATKLLNQDSSLDFLNSGTHNYLLQCSWENDSLYGKYFIENFLGIICEG